MCGDAPPPFLPGRLADDVGGDAQAAGRPLEDEADAERVALLDDVADLPGADWKPLHPLRLFLRIQLEDLSPRMGRGRIDASGRQVVAQTVGLGPRPAMNVAVVGEEVSRQAIDQGRPRQAFLDERPVVSERRDELVQAVRHLRSAEHALPFRAQHLGSDRRVPELLEGDRLLQVRPDHPGQNFAGDRLIEGSSRTDLVGVVDALDGLLGPDPVLEGQIAGTRLDEPLKRDEGTGGKGGNPRPSHGASHDGGELRWLTLPTYDLNRTGSSQIRSEQGRLKGRGGAGLPCGTGHTNRETRNSSRWYAQRGSRSPTLRRGGFGRGLLLPPSLGVDALHQQPENQHAFPDEDDDQVGLHDRPERR